MGIEEDRIELTGTPLEKLLYRLQEVGAGYVARGPDGNWQTVSDRPTGREYYEGFSSGEIRLYSGRGDGTYQLYRGGRQK